VYNLKKENS